MSAICSYSLSEIERVFSGNVKHKEDGVWKNRQNPGHINGVSNFLMHAISCTIDKNDSKDDIII